ncbi:MAG: hypothetical protein WAO76_06560 [Georgfuchsia sp.]
MFFLLWSLVGAVIGVGLIVRSEKVFRLFGMMNNYVSTRRGMKPLAMAHDIEPCVCRHRRLIGVFFMLGAAYSVYGLFAWFDTSTIISGLDLRYPHSLLTWILNCVRWFLMIFGVVAFVIGAMLGYFPHALGKLEALVNRWYSVRKHTVGLDTMHLTLDKWIAAFPRATGSILVLAALYVAANAAILWLGVH